MKKSIIVKIFVGALIIPIASLFLISKFNLFSYFDFIPVDYRFEAGLGSYMFVLDAIYEYIVALISDRYTKITFIIYKTKNEMNIRNTPTVVCSESNSGVASFNCNVILEGNLKKLRKIKVLLPLPLWVTSQISQDDDSISSSTEGVIWNFSKLLPSNGVYQQSIECTSKVPLIKNQNNNTLSIKVRPQLVKKHCWSARGIEFKSNKVVIKNGE